MRIIVLLLMLELSGDVYAVSIEALRQKWEDAKSENASKDFYQRVEVSMFDELLNGWTTIEMRQWIDRNASDESAFVRVLATHILRHSAQHEDYATLQMCLESFEINNVGSQDLGYFLAVQDDPLIFKVLFAACNSAITAKRNLIAESLLQVLRVSFRECRIPDLTTQETLDIAKTTYRQIRLELFLVKEATQSGLPPEQNDFDLRDFSNLFKRNRGEQGWPRR
jgi:hypothetical protein